MLRHYHPVAWLLLVVCLVLGFYSLVTGWRYVGESGSAVGWPFYLAVAAYMLALPIWRRLSARRAGDSGASTVPLSAVTSLKLTSTEIGWYFKTSKSVPTIHIRYWSDGEDRQRHVMLSLRAGQEEVRAAMDAFEAHDVPVEGDRSGAGIPLEQ